MRKLSMAKYHNLSLEIAQLLPWKPNVFQNSDFSSFKEIAWCPDHVFVKPPAGWGATLISKHSNGETGEYSKRAK